MTEAKRLTRDMPLDGICTHGYLELGDLRRCTKPATSTRRFAPTGKEYPCCDEHWSFDA